MSETVETPEQKENAALAGVNQVVTNAIAALMDVANLLRDVPRLVAANQALVQQLESAGVPLPGQEPTKPSAEA
jgi:hypothetical protein